MLYSNVILKSQEREFDFGKIHQIALGESGRGRKLLTLTCPAETVVKQGMNEGLSIGKTRAGKPRINLVEEDTLYMLLSAKGGYTRRGSGSIWVPDASMSEFEVMAVGNGADGDAGRIGSWTVALLKAPQNGIVRVRRSGENYGIPTDYFIIKDSKVYHCINPELEECFDGLGMCLPEIFYSTERGEIRTNLENWKKIW